MSSGGFDTTAANTFSGYTTFTGGVRRNSKMVYGNYQIVGSDHFILHNSATAHTITLPDPFSSTVLDGAEFIICTTDTGTVTVTVHSTGAQRILKLNGAEDTTNVITGQGKMVRYLYTGIGGREWIQAAY
jgi:hypothetical protein